MGIKSSHRTTIVCCRQKQPCGGRAEAIVDPDVWTERFEDAFARIAGCFKRMELTGP
jgi:hypothetical protein